MEQLGKEDSYFIETVARHPNLPVRTLERLAGDKDRLIRKAVAQNPSTPVRLLEQLAQDQEYLVREEVAQNPSTPIRFLEQLAQDQAFGPHVGVARNPSAPVKLLEQLAESQQISVRIALAQNPNTPKVLMEKLLGDESSYGSYVREELDKLRRQKLLEQRFAQTPNVLEGIFSKQSIGLRRIAQSLEDHIGKPKMGMFYHENVRYAVAINPNTPGSVLEQLAENKDWRIGSAIARHPNTPAIALEQLAKHQDGKVRTVVAKNPNTPAIILEQLVEDKEREIQEAAIENLSQNFAHKFNTPRSILEQFESVKNPQTPQDVLRGLTTSQWMLIRVGIARHPNTSVSLLEQLAGDKNSAVRQAVPRILIRQGASWSS